MANSTRPTERVRATVGPFFFVVQQQTAAIIQRLGKFERIAESGAPVRAESRGHGESASAATR